MSEKILDVNVVEQYKTDKLRYAMFTNKVRSVPSIKDGLKTIHRRILFCAFNDKRCIGPSNQIKSADLVGVVMGSYHPHGDSAIYGSMKPMTNWFEINMPLFNGEGNWGTFQGDDAAAMRYTETYLNKFALECVIGELAKTANVVDWSATYNQLNMEPEYLPVKVPLLLINGSFGIGYGLQVSVPTHNITEVLDATIYLMKNPGTEIVLVPDQCMPCDIIDNNFEKISKNGAGSFKVRGRVNISEETIRGASYPVLTIVSVPDGVYTDTIKNAIGKLLENGSLPQIHDIEDRSYIDKKTDRAVLNFAIILKRGSDPYYVRDCLYKHTQLENTISVSLEVLDGVKSLRPSYTEYLQYFIDFRRSTKRRYYSNVYQKADTILHEKEAFIKVLESGEVDNVIDKIKKQSTVNDKELVEYLIKKLHISDLQASYIINANIKKLSLGYLNRYKEEAKEQESIRNFADNMLRNPLAIDEEIINELNDFKVRYGKPRNARLIKQSDVNSIPKGMFNVVITENNFIKKVSSDTIGSFKGDAPKISINIDNTDSLLLFDSFGKVFKLPVHKVPISDKNSNGVDLRVLIKNITPVIQVLSYDLACKAEDRKVAPHVLTLTRAGFIKRIELFSVLAAPVSGYAYINLDNGDAVSFVTICSGADVVVSTHNKALRIRMKDIPVYKRNAKGVKTIASTKPVIVERMSLIRPDSTHILILTENGMLNMIHADSLPVSERNRAGSSLIKLAKNDRIKFILGVGPKDKALRISTNGGIADLPLDKIKMGSSISQGNKVVNKTSIILNAVII